MELDRTDDEINDQLNRAMEQEDAGGSRWPGMSYEQGVSAALNWAIGHIEDEPIPDDG